MLFTKGLGLTDGLAYKVCIVVASAAVLLKIAIERHSRKEYAIIAVLLVLGAANWMHTGNQGALMCILLVLAMKNIHLADVFRVGAVCWGLSYGVQIITQLLDLRARDFVIHSKLGFQHIIRWGLGYTHPNVLQIATLTLIAYVFYCYQYRTARELCKAMMAGIVLSLYIFLYSLSVTGMMMTAVFFLILGYLEWNRMQGRTRSAIENAMLQLIFPACVLFSVLAPLLLQGKAFDILNKVMTNRPTLSRYFLSTYGLLPLGGDFSGLSQNLTLDCSYVNLLMNGGWILFGLMCVGYFLLIRNLLHQPVSRENSIALAITFYTVIGASSEPFAFNTAYKNVSLFLLGNWMYRALGQQGPECIEILQNVTNSLARISSRCLTGGWKRRTVAAVIAILLGVGSSTIYSVRHIAPQDVYALRTHTDNVEEYEFLYYTPQEIDALRNTDGVWVLEYKDAESIMIRFSGEGIGETEALRTEVTICLSVALIVFTIVMTITNRKNVGSDVLNEC